MADSKSGAGIGWRFIVHVGIIPENRLIKHKENSTFFKRGPNGCDWENVGAPEYTNRIHLGFSITPDI